MAHRISRAFRPLIVLFCAILLQLEGAAQCGANGTACNDNNACTTNDVCFNGTCVGTPVVCNDNNSCTTDQCVPGIGCVYTNVANGTACTDNSICTTGDVCVNGSCTGTAITCPPDANPCTTAACHPVTGCYQVNNTNACDDGNPCTINDVCSGGGCAGTPKNCDDGNPCTTDFCVGGVCQHTSAPAGTACDDGNGCTTNDVCNGTGICAGTPVVCNDNNACTDDACVNGVCTYTPDDSNLCNDNSACTTSDYCLNGICTGQLITCPDDSNPCTTPVCNPMTGCGFVNNTNACDDGDPCTINDVCNGGGCAGTPKNCDDGNPCTTDFCVGGVCQHTPAPAGTACDDGNGCTTNDVCNGTGGCAGTPVVCNDNNACTDDACVNGVCTYTPDDSNVCSDNSACTTSDYCLNGICTGVLITCPDDSNPCTTPVCNPVTGCGFVNNTIACDDGDPCTINDVCSGGGCAGTPKNCDDGNPCTTDFCVGGVCQHSPAPAGTPCNDGNACTINDVCNGSGGCAGTAVVCNDNNSCTTDQCLPGIGCVYTNVANGTACNDNSICTTGDVCVNGSCTGTAITCPPDANPCTTAACHPVTGCYQANNTNACDDGNPCTINDVCSGGGCTGTPKNCDDGNPCTTDFCVGGVCQHTLATAGTACDDGNSCTTNDVCNGTGTCVGTPVVCNDNNSCTTDQCVPGIGCVYTNVANGTACNDNSACTTGDVCVNGICAGTIITCPPDANPCTTAACHPVTGCYQANNTNACDDGDPCTINDVCSGGSCSGTPIPCSSVTLNLRMFLEGPYSSVDLSMRDELRNSGLVPLTEPYTGLGYPNFTLGNEASTTAPVLTVTGADAIVDWVVVELRSAATPSTILFASPALVQRDGHVVDVDGLSALSMLASAGNYHVAVRHRNHLGVMTSTAVALSATTTVIDFTDPATSVWGTAARKTVGTRAVLWAGDVRFDKNIKYTGSGNDRDPILTRVGSTTPNNTAPGYYNTDTNMDGVVRYTGSANDRDPLLVNVGSTIPNNVRSEQLP